MSKIGSQVTRPLTPQLSSGVSVTGATRRAADALIVAEHAEREVDRFLRRIGCRHADPPLRAGIAEGVGEHAAFEEGVVIVAVVGFEPERRLVLADGHQVFGILVYCR